MMFITTPDNFILPIIAFLHLRNQLSEAKLLR